MGNFKTYEFECPCCKKNHIDIDLVVMLQRARTIANIPMVINSAYRCKKHNKEEKGKPTSSHLKGLAVDIKCTNGYDRKTIVEALILAGFNRIGIAETFIHADIDTSKTQSIWLY